METSRLSALRERLRLIVITDRRAAAPRSVRSVAESVLRAGAPALQLRDKQARARDLMEEARVLRELTRRHGAMLLVNDRFDIALAAEADGVHLGPDDIPVSAVRSRVPTGFVIGYSTDDPLIARTAQRDGADYIGCGTVFPTASKPDAGRSIGLDRLREVVDAVTIPVVGIGGIEPGNATSVKETGAAGVAVIGAVFGAADPAASVRALLDA